MTTTSTSTTSTSEMGTERGVLILISIFVLLGFVGMILTGA